MEFVELGEIEGIDLLQKLELFATLTYEETTRLGEIAEHRQVGQGGIIIEAESLGEALYVICEGEVEVSRADGEALGRLSTGDIFGEMSLVDDLLTSARVTASTPCTLLELPRSKFSKLLAGDNDLAVKIYRAFCRTLSDRLRRVNELLGGAEAFSVGVR